MRKVDDGKKKKKKKEEKNGVFSGHYVIASSRQPERRPLERRTLAPICLLTWPKRNSFRLTSPFWYQQCFLTVPFPVHSQLELNLANFIPSLF